MYLSSSYCDHLHFYSIDQLWSPDLFTCEARACDSQHWLLFVVVMLLNTQLLFF